MAVWKLSKDGEYVNTIVADKAFACLYAEANGYTIEEVLPSLVPAQQREQAYDKERIIAWDGDMITVTQAAALWQYYAAEGSDNASSLQGLIASAKSDIRKRYPDD